MPRIAFVGSGIATSYTLIPLLDELENRKIEVPLEFFIIDKHDDFFKGLPYGNRSSKSVLLIQNLKNFISDPHRKHFKDWLDNNKEELVQEFLNHGGAYATKWVEDNSGFYNAGDWDELYVPRFFFGTYIEKEVTQRIERFKNNNKVNFHFIRSEVTKIEKKLNQFAIHFKDHANLETDRVILSIGSLPFKNLFKGKEEGPYLYINQSYQPTLEHNLARVKKFVKANSEARPMKVLVLGANASGLEMVYKICDELPIGQYNLDFTSLSSHGTMPDGYFEEEKAKAFKAVNLELLQKESSITANDIAEAANKDIDEAELLGIGAATSVGIISEGFGRLLPQLSSDELLNFARFHGNQIGRRQRCAGQHYLSVVEDLKNEKRFKHLKARFHSIEATKDGLLVNYKENNNSNSELFDIVVNCLGSQNLESNTLGSLYGGILKDKLCVPNASNIGFAVDENMQASENFYVAGPLLAGNRIQDKVFWHLEHCNRIIWSSEQLARNVLLGMTELVR